MPPKFTRSPKEVVSRETYQVWVGMLRQLVPDGRTHRLCVLIAGMYSMDLPESKSLTKEI